MSNWQKVFQDNQQYRAEIVKAVLEDAGMNPVLVDKKDSAYQFGHYEVRVAAEDVIETLRLINEEIRFE
ncbi:DUF2007 domain-containing protein [Marinoscillum sp. MHG1-6]|uniref:DUF2007 domain-containing protein n=1 Tax=Marinoscillum sp. MHG1-6 TaxID=2959627 RepID=UPI002157954F|nr:DUF2007 domain-containing protein [Marinoscillum sp. MHG1-6]